MQEVRPDYIFEVSWEVCNKVGGIYTVITSKAPVVGREYGDKLIFVGPDVWKGAGENPDFVEDRQLFKTWREQTAAEGLHLRIGRWNIPSQPIAILIDFTPFFARKNEIFTELWLKFKLNSLSGQWDYVEPTLFGYAAGQVIESFYRFYLANHQQVVAQFHEWMTGTGILYLRDQLPQIATVFTTHATVMGRSIAGNRLPLYSQLHTFNADQYANSFNVAAKQSLEKTSAQNADAFTTVSQLTAAECEQFLGKAVDIVTPNGFDPAFVPTDEDFETKRNEARKLLLEVAAAVCQTEPLPENTLLVATSGRYEFRNKGIDLLIASLAQLRDRQSELGRPVVAFILVPATKPARAKALLPACAAKRTKKTTARTTNCSPTTSTTAKSDAIVQAVEQNQLDNHQADSQVKVIFVPTYLNGYDGLFNKTYYDLLIGFDLTLFPSYYEPWGYTPLESLAFRVPTITTTLAGFGLWVNEVVAENTLSGVTVIPRTDENDEEVIARMTAELLDFAKKEAKAVETDREAAAATAQLALWEQLADHYFTAYEQALEKVHQRADTFAPTSLLRHLGERQGEPLTNKPKWKRILIQSKMPKGLEPLQAIANNLWWVWQADAQQLFERINPKLWQQVDRNPIALLDQLSYKEIQHLLRDKDFMEDLQAIEQRFNEYIEAPVPEQQPKIAYFCMEYGLHSSVRLYSGGLGILAGDYLKEASDCQTDMVGIGLLYRYGYFQQQLSYNGEQIANYEPQRFSHLPLLPVKDADGNWLRIQLALPGRTLYAKIWRIDVGRVPLYLLDTDIADNNEQDRQVTSQLYGGDWEHRLKQEMLLGIGGIRLLDALQIKPDLYHCNEGHAAFLTLERLRKYVQEDNLSYDEALEVVRASSLFTTHTPVPAGHDAFTEDLLRAYISNYDNELNISWEKLMGLGRLEEHNAAEKFSMSHLAVRTSQEVNGVSKIHGEVSRKMFSDLWEGYHRTELHIDHVTNGVHYGTWIAPEWHQLFTDQLGPNFYANQLDKNHWRKIHDVDDVTLWNIRKKLKARLLTEVNRRLEVDLRKRNRNPREIYERTHNIKSNVLIIGFARRFATYKRAHLLFYNLEKLSQIVGNKNQPVLFLFAGKAHPADGGGQDLIRQIVEVAERQEFWGKVVFLENYDMDLARLMVQGVDVWLNTPTRPQEASGTSGMKATLNGVLNFSVLDGWWAEGYRPDLGWALQQERTYENQDFQNQLDAETIYDILERDIVPTYFTHNDDQLSHAWLQRMKVAIAEIAPEFTTRRMLNDYQQKFYSKLYERTLEIRNHNFAEARTIAQWKRKVRRYWESIEVVDVQVYDTSNNALPLGEPFQATLTLNLSELSIEDVGIELLVIERTDEKNFHIVLIEPLKAIEQHNNLVVYRCEIQTTQAGVYDYGFRIYPKHELLPYKHDFNLVRWV